MDTTGGAPPSTSPVSWLPAAVPVVWCCGGGNSATSGATSDVGKPSWVQARPKKSEIQPKIYLWGAPGCPEASSRVSPVFEGCEPHLEPVTVSLIPPHLGHILSLSQVLPDADLLLQGDSRVLSLPWKPSLCLSLLAEVAFTSGSWEHPALVRTIGWSVICGVSFRTSLPKILS